MITDPYGVRASNREGWVHVFTGGNLTSGNYELYDDTELLVYGDNEGDAFGFGVQLADLDGDGYEEVLAGAPFEDEGAEDAGCVHVLPGSATLAASERRIGRARIWHRRRRDWMERSPRLPTSMATGRSTSHSAHRTPMRSTSGVT